MLYDFVTCTMTIKLKKHFNVCSLEMLRIALNFSWQSQTMNLESYGEFPSRKVQQRKIHSASFLVRHHEES